MKIRVQKGVPLPEGDLRGRKSKYPWHEMEVGDSFLFPATIRNSGHTVARAQSRGEKKFRVLKTNEGYRCWRIK